MTESFYCKIYDTDFNLTHNFKNHNEYYNSGYNYNVIKMIYVFNYSQKLSWYLFSGITGNIFLNGWFEDNGWDIKEGFNTDEKKILFKLKFL